MLRLWGLLFLLCRWMEETDESGALTNIKKVLDSSPALMLKRGTIETVDAEITAGMIPQRARDAENRAELQSVKWTAEGAVKGSGDGSEYSAT